MHITHIFTALVFVYFIVTAYYVFYTKSEYLFSQPSSYRDAVAIVDISLENGTSIFDTCPLILYNHLDPELLKFHHPGYNPKANCYVYKPFTELVGAQVQVKDKAKDYKCQARCILPMKDRKYIVRKWIDLPSTNKFECDVIETMCTKDNTTEAFLHTQIYEQKDAQKITEKPDVYLLIIDSVSSFMAKRSLPRTLEYLKTMGAVQMEFLNKVGDNSRPNGFPLAFGGNRQMVGLPPLVSDWNNTKICHEYLDKYSYHLWEYAKMGYKTMIAQDFDVGIVYYPHCLGFSKSEADHIWRPFDLRRESSKMFKKNFDDSCSERHLEMMDYLEKFMNAYPGTPKIAQLWPTTLAHESLKDLYHADEHFLTFFKKNRALVDRSFFFFMGDHGPRREGIGEVRLGQYENLNPFLVVMIPSKYRNSSIHHQLHLKANELMTLFDVHATLMDILKLQPATGFSDTAYRDLMPISKGSSLLREWRGVRNCRTLPIPSAYCICQYNRTAVSDGVLLEKLGNFFAEQFNHFLRSNGLSEKCQPQFYNRTATVMEIQDGNTIIYDTTVYLNPSGGLFTAHISSNSAGFKLSSGFSRLSRYGRQGDCLIGDPLRPLCHCSGTTEP